MGCNLYNCDCLDELPSIPDESIDMILCDLPYGTTQNKWGTPIDLQMLWMEYERIVKVRGSIVLFSQMPFTAKLIMSNTELFKYEWIWEKCNATGMLNCNYAPMKAHENILVFSKSCACYVKDKTNAMIYNPQMSCGVPYTTTSGQNSTNYGNQRTATLTVNTGNRYPRDVLRFSRDKLHLHPTQKPVPLLEYLIRTYTNVGETILDNCMGSGSTGVAAVHTNRNFIGMELDETYYKIAKERIESAIPTESRAEKLFR